MSELKLIPQDEIIENSIELIAEKESDSRQKNLHSSSIKHYYNCPHKFTLSRKHKIEKSTDALTNGLLFEGYVFGFKDEPGYSEFEIRGLGYNKDGSLSKGKGKQDKTIQPIKESAEFIKTLFGDGESFVKLEYDGNYKNGLLKGEADFIGDHWIGYHLLDANYDLKDEKIRSFGRFEQPMIEKRVIADLKKTSDIYYLWNIRSQKQVIQSIIYPYIWYKNTGEILDFVYTVFWDKSETIFKQLYFRTTQETFDLAEKIIDELESDLFKRPDAEVSNCLGKGAFGSPCEFIEFCEFGRDLVASSDLIDITKLDPINRRWNNPEVKEFFESEET